MALISVVGFTPSVGATLAQPPMARPFPSVVARAGAVGHPDRTPDAKLTLRVYNYAQIDPKALARSEKVASAIFESVGIELLWEGCALSPADLQAYPACQSAMGTADLVVRILTRNMSMKLRVSREPLGFAQLCPENEPACELTVFYHRVDELATNGYRADLILGHVIAHEVAHVLIGPGHSEAGIMRAEWSHDDLQRISWGLTLNFTNNQSRQLRSAILRRTIPH